MEIDKLIALHKDSVYRQLVRTCGNREDAEDALVESLVAAWQASDRLENPAAFRGWVGTIARRVCTHIRESDKLKPVLGDEGFVESVAAVTNDPEAEAEFSQMKGCISEAVSSLPEEYREVYVLRELQGAGTTEVAEKLGLSEAAVKSRLHRARDRVRDALDQSVCASYKSGD